MEKKRKSSLQSQPAAAWSARRMTTSPTPWAVLRRILKSCPGSVEISAVLRKIPEAVSHLIGSRCCDWLVMSVPRAEGG